MASRIQWFRRRRSLRCRRRDDRHGLRRWMSVVCRRDLDERLLQSTVSYRLLSQVKMRTTVLRACNMEKAASQLGACEASAGMFCWTTGRALGTCEEQRPLQELPEHPESFA